MRVCASIDHEPSVCSLGSHVGLCVVSLMVAASRPSDYEGCCGQILSTPVGPETMRVRAWRSAWTTTATISQYRDGLITGKSDDYIVG